jgi:hypothetical protein
MAGDYSPPSHNVALGSSTSLIQASTQTIVNSSEQKSPLHHHQASLIDHDSHEKNEIGVVKRQLSNNHKQESVMDLKIRLAVLENDLAHKEQERKEAVSACHIIARVLGSDYARAFANTRTGDYENNAVLGTSEKWRILEQEIQTLKRENGLLWKKIGSRHSGQSVDSLTESDDDILESKTRRRLVSGGNDKKTTTDKEKTSLDEGFNPNDRSPSLSRHTPKNQASGTSLSTSIQSEPSNTPIYAQETHNAPDVLAESKTWGQSLDSGTTTVPNSPVIAPYDTQHTQLLFQDVGFESLDDIIGPEGSGIPPPIRPTRVLFNATKAEEPGIRDDMQKQMNSMISLDSLPAPTVLRTGFDLNGSFKGGDYVPIPRRPRAFERIYRSGNTSFSDVPASSSSSYYSHDTSFRDSAGYFRYGIQYVPSETDSKYRRRITISNLPRNTKIKEVLAQVRGGEVVSANRLDTEKLTGGITVIVQFLHGSSAEQYSAYTKDHPIHFGSSAQKAEVTLVKTPTWPLTTGLYPSILKQKQKRCLAIPSFPKVLSIAELERNVSGNIPFRSEALLDIYSDEQETLHLEFSCMVAAHFAYDILTKWQKYSELKPIFALDPCAGAVEELASRLPPVRRNVPEYSCELIGLSHNSSSSCGENRKSEANQGEYLEDKQENPVAPSSCEPIIIPSFSGSNIKSSSWADEVIEEAESSATVLSSEECTHSDVLTHSHTLSAGQIDEKDGSMDMTIRNVLIDVIHQQTGSTEHSPRKPPVGLSSSKYASIIPGHSDLPTSQKSMQRIISEGPESQADISAVTVDMFPWTGATHKVETRHFTSNNDKDTLKEGATYPSISTAPHHESPLSPSLTPAETTKACSQSPPRIHLDSLLKSPPSSSASNIGGPTHKD